MEIGFLFGATFTVILWLAAAFLYVSQVSLDQVASSPEPIVFGIMASLITIPIVGFCTSVVFGSVVFFAELAVRSARRENEPDVRALSCFLTGAERRFAASKAPKPAEEAIRPPQGLAPNPTEPNPTPPSDEIQR
jgi:hypothetical protein